MDGISIRGVTLYLGKMPNRKGLCFYFHEGTKGIPLAYVRKKNESEAIRLWEKFVAPIWTADDAAKVLFGK